MDSDPNKLEEPGFFSTLSRERPLIWLSGLVLFVYSFLALFRHYRFQTAGIDLGFYDQIIWNISQGRTPFSSLMGPANAFGDHFDPILALIAPLYWVFPGAGLLLVIQPFLAALSAVPVFMFAKRRLGRLPAYLWTAAYVVFWGFQSAIAADFHPDLFAAAFIAFAIEFIDRRKWTGAFICLGLCLLEKEDMGLLLFFFGVYLLFLRQWKKGAACMALGMAGFFITVMFLLPYLGQTTRYPKTFFSHLGNSNWEYVQTVLSHPLLVVKLCFSNTEKIMTMACSYLACCGMIFFSPLLVLTFPIFLERMLSNYEHHWSMGYYYSVTLAPILFMGGLDGIFRLSRNRGLAAKKKLVRAVSAMVLVLGLVSVPIFPLRDLMRAKFYRHQPWVKEGYQALALIPADAKVIAQDTIIPHLSHRREIYLLDGGNCSTDCDYLVACRKLNSWPSENYGPIQDCVRQMLNHGYTSVFEDPDWVLLKKTTSQPKKF